MKYFITTLFFCLSFTLFSQSGSDLEKGDRAFDAMIYDEALYYYESANDYQPNNPDITRRIGKVYRRIGLPAAAAEWIKKTIDLGTNNPDDMLDYAEVLKTIGQYDEAVKWYNAYKSIRPEDKRAISHTIDPEYHLDLFADTLKYISKTLKINNADPVIGVTPYENRKLLIAAVNLENQTKPEDDASVYSYLDIYIVEQDNQNELIKPKKLGENINTRYHDGPVCYSFDGKSMFITRNNIKKNKAVIDKQGTVNTKIYESKFENKNWQPAIELPINNDDYSNAHPTITRDGNELYFSSNRPGGYGGMDIYVVVKENGVWGEPKNLGPQVNTEGNEMFPYISNIGTLYFASDGHAGLGGLDIFFAEKNKDRWLSPLNMGVPLNGPFDDFAIYYDDTNDQGYFCSNRSGKGNDDIFFFRFKSLGEMILAGNLTIKDQKYSLEGQTVRIESKNRNDVSYAKIDARGNFQYIAQPGDDVVVTLMDSPFLVQDSVLFAYTVPDLIKDPYKNIGRKQLEVSNSIEAEKILKKYNPDLYAVNDPKFSVNNPVSFTQPKEKTIAEDKKSDASSISNTQANSSKQDKPMSSFDRSVSIINMDSLQIQNIYFDYNKSDIKDQYKSVLDKIVSLLNEDSEAIVLVKAHCDSRGNKAYNENLSILRAFAVKDYLLKKGIARNRMKINWYGEEKLVNHCTDSVPCSEAEYELNRRAEFKIIKK